MADTLMVKEETGYSEQFHFVTQVIYVFYGEYYPMT